MTSTKQLDPWHGKTPSKAEVAAKINEILGRGWARVIEREERRLRETTSEKRTA